MSSGMTVWAINRFPFSTNLNSRSGDGPSRYRNTRYEVALFHASSGKIVTAADCLGLNEDSKSPEYLRTRGKGIKTTESQVWEKRHVDAVPYNFSVFSVSVTLLASLPYIQGVLLFVE